MSSNRTIAIYLNIYDLHDSNAFIAPLGLGLYHTGVEIEHKEYYFTPTGIHHSNQPRHEAFGQFKEQQLLGQYPGSLQEIKNVLHRLGKTRFRPGDYDPVACNCNHFSEAIAEELLGERLPVWINRLAHWGQAVLPKSVAKSMMGTAEGQSEGMVAPGRVDTPAALPIDTVPAEEASTSTTHTNTNTGTADCGMWSSVWKFFSSPPAPVPAPVPAPAVAPAAASNGRRNLTEKQRAALDRLKGSSSASTTSVNRADKKP